MADREPWTFLDEHWTPGPPEAAHIDDPILHGTRWREALDRIVIACDNGAKPEDKLTFIRRVADEARALPSPRTDAANTTEEAR